MDEFPDVRRNFSASADRQQRITALLERVDAAEVQDRLTKWLADANSAPVASSAGQEPRAEGGPLPDGVSPGASKRHQPTAQAAAPGQALGVFTRAVLLGVGVAALIVISVLLALVVSQSNRSQQPQVLVVPIAQSMQTLAKYGRSADSLDTPEQFDAKVKAAGESSLKYQVSEDRNTETRKLQRLVLALKIQNDQLVAAMRYLTAQHRSRKGGTRSPSQQPIIQTLLPLIEDQIESQKQNLPSHQEIPDPVTLEPRVEHRKQDLPSQQETPDLVSFAPPDGSQENQLPKNLPEQLPASRSALRPKMITIRPGSFLMGSDTSSYEDEKPLHKVILTVRFQMSETEVTQGQYRAVMGLSPSQFSGNSDSDRRPVETVSWIEATRYCNKLSLLEGLETCYETGRNGVKWPKKQKCTGYRLPTEAEWEYAARAGQKSEYAGSSQIMDVAWVEENSGGSTHPVGRKNANAWSLYDMSGNVWEWVWDWYAKSYDPAILKDPSGPAAGSLRVMRGGSILDAAGSARVTYRLMTASTDHGTAVGFRLARSIP